MLCKNKTVLKLIDFGVSTMQRGSYVVCNEVAGTPNYMAPEIMEGLGYNELIDIWCVMNNNK